MQIPGQTVILAHYMPWFEANPARKQWGWHWTMNAFDPGKPASDGRRPIASHYYPLIGPYDSGDRSVLEYHLLLMKLSGIDGVIVDWYGLSDLFDYPLIHRNTIALLHAAVPLGMKIAVCYEDQTISKLVERKRLDAADRVKHAREEINWLRANWFRDPAYLKFNGKPLLLSFGWEGLTETEWAQVFDDPRPPAPLYLSEQRRRTVADGAFDWPSPQKGLSALDTFYQAVKAERPAVFLPVAFPRFHDMYKEAKVGESYGLIPDDNGRTFTTTLERALRSGAPAVQIATWNDWGEGTGIEPTKEFGYRDLEAVQRLRRKLVDPRFAPRPDDLRLPYRLWQLRQQSPTGRENQADTVARLLATGKTAAAKSYLDHPIKP